MTTKYDGFIDFSGIFDFPAANARALILQKKNSMHGGFIREKKCPVSIPFFLFLHANKVKP